MRAPRFLAKIGAAIDAAFDRRLYRREGILEADALNAFSATCGVVAADAAAAVGWWDEVRTEMGKTLETAPWRCGRRAERLSVSDLRDLERPARDDDPVRRLRRLEVMAWAAPRLGLDREFFTQILNLHISVVAKSREVDYVVEVDDHCEMPSDATFASWESEIAAAENAQQEDYFTIRATVSEGMGDGDGAREWRDMACEARDARTRYEVRLREHRTRPATPQFRRLHGNHNRRRHGAKTVRRQGSRRPSSRSPGSGEPPGDAGGDSPGPGSTALGRLKFHSSDVVR